MSRRSTMCRRTRAASCTFASPMLAAVRSALTGLALAALPAVVALAQAPPAGEFIAGQLLVKAREGQLPALTARLAELLPGSRERAAFPHREVAHKTDRVGLARILVVDVEAGSEGAALAALLAESAVEWAELNGTSGGAAGQIV